MKSKIIRILFSVVLIGVLLIGCQKSPEKSAVVSKADGLDKEVVEAPLESEDVYLVDMPKQWKAEDERKNGQVKIEVDMELDPISVGNLPVVEMKNRAMSQPEYDKLVQYFTTDPQECSDFDSSSEFEWQVGEDVISESDILSLRRWNQMTANNENAEKWDETLDKLQTKIEQETIDEKGMEKKAKQILTDLEIDGMTLLSVEPILWFPKGAIANYETGLSEDKVWQADMNQAVAGYQFLFTRMVAGLVVDQNNGVIVNPEAGGYAPPYSTEKIEITLTNDEMKSFFWQGMCETIKNVAENTKLLKFEEIQEALFDQIFYWHPSGQPAEDKRVYTFHVTQAKLGYSYVAAYEQPEHAWLVPTWFFTVTQSISNAGVDEQAQEQQDISFMINALDGGIIGKPL